MKLALSLALALATATTAYADTLVTIRPTGTDSVDWAQLGPAFSSISNPFSFTTALAGTGTGTYAGGNGQRRDQGNGWAGNFTLGDALNWNAGSGTITLTFAQSYTQIGAQIQQDTFGGFTAQVCNINGCFTEAGSSSSAGDGSAIYIGISSATPFNSISFSLVGNNDFAINGVTLGGGVAPTPEPSSFALLGTGVLGAAGMVRRRFRRS